MKSHTTERFRKALAALPSSVRQQARESYRLFKQNPQHPSLRFKRVHGTHPIYSARINEIIHGKRRIAAIRRYG